MARASVRKLQRGLAMLRCVLPWCLLALPWTAGCASADPPLVAGTGGSAELTVRVWSTAVQGPVAGRGTVREVGGEARLEFDTSRREAVSQTFPGLRPGLYEVRVEERWDGPRTRPVAGSTRLFLEPGERGLAIPVAVDRAAETGQVPERGQLWRPGRQPELPGGPARPAMAGAAEPATPR